MRKLIGVQPKTVSRRSALRRLAVTVGGTAVLAGSLIRTRAAAEQTKMPKSAVGYQDGRQGDQDCANCVQFQAPAACKVVEGNISPGAWCKVYAKMPT